MRHRSLDHYVSILAVHVFEVAFVGSAVSFAASARQAYNIVDMLDMVAVGVIAGATYVTSIGRLEKRERERSREAAIAYL